jgi:tripartite-type tricarboxylate transporter receptor subunit TctC
MQVISSTLLFLLSVSAAVAQQFPTRPIRLIVPFAPGGGSDYYARLVGEKMRERLGQSVIIDNRAGAGGNQGTELAINAAPDGHTILIISASYLLNTILYKAPYDALDAITPIVNIELEPSLMAVHPKVPAKSIKEFIDLARQKPDALNFASAGTASLSHLSWELFMDIYKVKMVHVPYKGTGPAINDVIAGNVQTVSGGVTLLLPHVRSGRLRALGVTSAERLPIAPDIPTTSEALSPGWVRSVWHGLVGPKGTPAVAVNRINHAVVEALKGADMQARFKAQGVVPAAGTAQGFAAIIRDEYGLWREFVTRTGIKVE